MPNKFFIIYGLTYEEQPEDFMYSIIQVEQQEPSVDREFCEWLLRFYENLRPDYDDVLEARCFQNRLKGCIIQFPLGRLAPYSYEKLCSQIDNNLEIIRRSSEIESMFVGKHWLDDTRRDLIWSALQLRSMDRNAELYKSLGKQESELHTYLDLFLHIASKDYSLKRRKPRNGHGQFMHHLWIRPEVARKYGLRSQSGYCPISELLDEIKRLVPKQEFWVWL